MDAQSRRAWALQLIAGLDERAEVAANWDVAGVLAELAALVPAFLGAMRNHKGSVVAPSSLQDAVERTARLASFLDHPMDRPFRSVWLDLRAAVGHLVTAERSWLGTLVAATPQAAQEAATLAQRELDAAGSCLARASVRVAELESVMAAGSDEKLELAMGIGRDRWQVASAGTPSIQSFDRFGHERLARVVGPDVVMPDGFGLGLLMTMSLGEVVMDSDRLFRLAAATYSLLRGHAGLSRLVDDPVWVAAFSEAEREVTRALERAAALHDAASDEDDHARAELLGIQDLVEGPLKFLLATILAILQRKTVGQFNSRDVGQLLHQFRDAVVDLEYDGVSMAARNASAHNQFSVTEDGVELTYPKSPSCLSWSELQDASLATIETLTALNLGITCALITEGLLARATESARTELLKSPDVVAALSLATGANLVRVEVLDDLCRVEVADSVSSVQALLGAIEACVPSPVRVIELIIPGGQYQLRVLTAAIDSLARRHDPLPGALGEELAYAEAMHCILLDGAPYLKNDVLRALIAKASVMAWSDDPSAAMRTLRSCRDLARRSDAGELDGLVTSAMRAFRLRESGLAVDAGTAAHLQQLVDLSKATVGDMFEDL